MSHLDQDDGLEIFVYTLYKTKAIGLPSYLNNTVKWGNIEQSYLFHGNSLIIVYNSHVVRGLCFRSVTEAFCSPPLKFLNAPTTSNLLFWPKKQFSNEKI